MLLALGVVLIGRGVLGKNVGIRDSTTWDAWLWGRVATKLWEKVYIRTLYVAIGIAAILTALALEPK